jgi:hypothetical protein
MGDLRSGGGGAYKTREPGPYWPERGKAHTTCKAGLVAFVAVAFRLTRVLSSAVGGSTGIINCIQEYRDRRHVRESGSCIRSGPGINQRWNGLCDQY